MADRIQIKRSAVAASTDNLAPGEPFYSGNSGVLFIGTPDNQIAPIAGIRTPGTLTANQALVANATSWIDRVKAAALTLGVSNGSANSITLTSNSSVLGLESNTELTSSWQVSNYIKQRANTTVNGSAVINALDFGEIDPTGVSDCTTAFNNLLANCAAAGKTVYVPAGLYRFNGAIKLVSNLRVNCEHNTQLIKYFRTTGASGFLAQNSYVNQSDAIANVIWTQGTLVSPDPYNDQYAGNMIGLFGNDLTFDRLTINGYGSPTRGGRAMAVAGNNIKVLFPRFYNCHPNTGNGGIRVLSGSGFLCIGGYVEAGDDVFQFVPSVASNSANKPYYTDSDITNGSYIGCVGLSYNARLFVAGVGNQTAEVGANGFFQCQASVTDCSFIGIRGIGGGRPALLQNTDSAGKIARINITDCMLGGLDDVNNNSVLITGWLNGGGVEDIALTNVSVIGSANTAVSIDGRNSSTLAPLVSATGAVRRVRWIGGKINAPGDGSSSTVKVLAANGVSFSDMEIVCGNSSGVMLGQGSNTISMCTAVRFSDVLFSEINDNQKAINNLMVDDEVVMSCRFIASPTLGTANSSAIFNSPSLASYVRVRDSDLSLVTSPTKVTNPSVRQSSVRGCRGFTDELVAVIKSSDESRTTTTTLANDSELILTNLRPNSVYEIQASVRWNQGSSALGGIQFQLPVTSSSGGYDWEYTVAPGLTAARNNQATVQAPTLATALNERIFNAFGILATGSTSANVALQWAQQTSNASATTVRANSVLRARLLS